MLRAEQPSGLKPARAPNNFSLRSSPPTSDGSISSRWRRNRSSINPLAQAQQPDTNPTPALPSTSAHKIERTPSRMSLFNLFSKPKVEKARGHTEVGLAVPMGPQEPPKPAPLTKTTSATRLNSDASTISTPRSRSSVVLKSPSQNTPTPRHRSLHWEPPPLFQAYPQAIKYATVQACTSSPDVLLRTQSQRRQYNLLRERMDSHRDLSATLESVPESKKLEKAHKRLISNSILNPSTPELTNKIYVLVTAGFVLQYAGDGTFDRAPEKVLQLGKESAAFASDAIPGRHWVLQISQSAKEDGTVSMAPKTSLLSKFRLQNSVARKAASSFLLVLDSAEEMDSWLTAVRREIDSLGGMKARDEPEASATTATATVPSLQQKTSHRFLVQRDPHRISRVSPVDSPLQSQTDSPQIFASDWEEEKSEKSKTESRTSESDSASLRSSRYTSMRKSIEAPSVATTVASTEQFQLDQLRERSRYSYISNATSASGTQTRNTSRNSSPTPNSPLKEGFTPVEAEPLRSATSLRSFHMNPSNANTAWRRSMQPLPITTEDSSLSSSLPSAQTHRHSVYVPTSPASRRAEYDSNRSVSSTYNRPTSIRFDHSPPKSVPGLRSASAPPSRNSTISPPPRDPAPPPGRPQSTFGPPSNGTSSVPARRASGQKPFMRPIPVRPQISDGSIVVPRRFSSLGPAPIPLGIVVNRSVTAPVRPTGGSSPVSRQTKPTPPPQQLRRPISMQIRSDHAPFLSSSRPTTNTAASPARVISSTPSFVPGRRASNVPDLRQPPSNPLLREQHRQSQQEQQEQRITPRRSMPVIVFPPPAPPPNMPLPPPPPVSAHAVAV